MPEYGQNIIMLRGRIDKVAEEMIGEFKDKRIIKALIEVPSQKGSQLIPVQAFGGTGQRILDNQGQWVHLEGKLSAREWEGKHFTSNTIFEVWTRPGGEEEPESDYKPGSVPPPPPAPEESSPEEDVPF